MTPPTDERPELLTPGTYVRRFFALLAIGGATVSGQVTAVSPLTERVPTNVLSVRELGVGNGPPLLISRFEAVIDQYPTAGAFAPARAVHVDLVRFIATEATAESCRNSVLDPQRHLGSARGVAVEAQSPNLRRVLGSFLVSSMA